jgi:uncharacterized protein (DUF1501 family)
MASVDNSPVLIIVQLSGGNDCLNTVIPYSDPRYRDHRPALAIPEKDILPIDDNVGFHPSMGPIKNIYDEGKVAVIQGIGYSNPSRSHFRSMDIWHTCEPDKVATEGWLGRAIRQIDPNKENVLTGVNFGRGMPHALAVPGVPIASVGNLETYGLFTDMDEEQRTQALADYARIYGPSMGRGVVMDYLSQTAMDAWKGADILRNAPAKYSSTVEYGSDVVSQYLRMIAQVYLANLGTRVFYTSAPYNSFDTHANQAPSHSDLWGEISTGVRDFFDDLHQHNAGENVVMLMFSEFGRRVKDNGSGTDHGSGGVAFVIGDKVRGGLYGEYPSLSPEKLLEGDLHFNYDFRGLYIKLLENWMGLDSKLIVNGSFEQFSFL